MPIRVENMMHLKRAFEALQAGDSPRARRELAEYESEFAAESEIATPYEKMGVLAAAAKMYLMLGDYEVAAMKFQDICEYAEKHEPGTVETAGDYAQLSAALEKAGRLRDALDAWETYGRHIKQTDQWGTYKKGYERHRTELCTRLGTK